MDNVPAVKHTVCLTELRWSPHGKMDGHGFRELTLWCPRCNVSVTESECTAKGPYSAATK